MVFVFEKQPVYFYNERTWLNRSQKNTFFKEDRFFSEKPLVASVGRECVLGVLGALGGRTIEEEGVCCFSCGWVGWMGAKETKAKGCCAERDRGCRQVCWGGGAACVCWVFHTEEALGLACATQTQGLFTRRT